MPEAAGERLLLCCVLDGEDARGLPLAELPAGPFAQPALRIEAASLAAITCALPGAGELMRPRVAEVLAYSRLIDSVHQSCTTLPVRFGTVLAGHQAVQAHLAEHAAAYRRLLSELQGAVEVSVRLPLPAPTPEPPAEPQPSSPGRSGAAYLRALQARHVQARQQEDTAAREAEQLAAALAPGTRAHVISARAPAAPNPRTEGQPPAVAVTFLLDRTALPGFRGRVAELAAESGRALTVHGPFPPYSFVQLD